MTQMRQRLLGLLRVLRVHLLLVAVSNIWLIVFLTTWPDTPTVSPDAATRLPLEALLLLTAVVAIGLQGYGSALNDVLDRRHDRVFFPDRPLAAGTLGRPGALSLAVILLLVGVFAAVLMGVAPAILAIITALGVLFYNTIGKFIPAVGIVTLGLARAGLMFVPNYEMAFIYPIWLAMSQVVACHAIVHRVQNKRPLLEGTQVWLVLAGWLFWTLLLFFWMQSRPAAGLTTFRGAWIGPLIVSIPFIIITLRHVRANAQPHPGRRARSDRYLQLSLIWLILYDAAWLLSLGWWGPACVHGALFLAALVLGTSLGRPAQPVHLTPLPPGMSTQNNPGP